MSYTAYTARALALTIYFAASSPQHNGNPSGKLHSRLKEGFVRTQRTPLVTGLGITEHLSLWDSGNEKLAIGSSFWWMYVELYKSNRRRAWTDSNLHSAVGKI